MGGSSSDLTSMSMPGAGGGEPAVQETALSRKQAEILKDREAFTQDFTIPELMDQLEYAKNLELSNDFQRTPQTLLASRDIGNIRSQFDVAEDQLSVSLAKRGLEGSGIEARTLSQLAGAEAASVSDRANQVDFNTMQEQNAFIQQRNQNLLAGQAIHGQAVSGLLSMAPQASSAAPVNMTMTGGDSGALGSTLAGGAQGATLGSSFGPWGAVIGGAVGAGAGYMSSQ
jgi:hypothetical protein